jgi:hypothetical protein
LTPAVGSDTTTAWGISGKIQYRPHNADRSERGLLNVLPRTQKLSPLCTPPLSLTSPGLPVPRGVSGGGAALSPGF